MRELREAMRRMRGDGEMKSLSNELIVACEIWHYNSINQPIWFTKLVENLKEHMDKQTVSAALDTLEDWLIAFSEYGPTLEGHVGRVWFIDTHDNGDFRIRDLYEECWKDARNKK